MGTLETASEVGLGQAKPCPPRYQTNIVVRVEEGSNVTTKIIDLGLAKPAADGPSCSCDFDCRSFAGTPELPVRSSLQASR
jgi:hypothetical protein